MKLSNFKLMKPLGSFCQVQYIEKIVEKTTSTGLVLPQSNIEKQRIVQVLAVGPGRYNPFKGESIPCPYKVGDLLYTNQHGPVMVLNNTKVKVEEETFLLGESDIYALYRTYAEAVEEGLVEEFDDFPVEV